MILLESSPALSDESMKITLVPAFLLMFYMVYCCRTLIKKESTCWGCVPVFSAISFTLDTQPSVMLARILAIPLPLSYFSLAYASADSTALILAASPSFCAATFLR